VGVEVNRSLQITNSQHSMKNSHDLFLVEGRLQRVAYCGAKFRHVTGRVGIATWGIIPHQQAPIYERIY